jgi:hypothetical protein
MTFQTPSKGSSQNNCTSSPEHGSPRTSGSVRPNGPGERSPGLRPKADALGGREDNSLRPEGPREPSCRVGFSRLFRPQRWGAPCLPRASAFGLSPGLGSPDPLGRTEADGFQFSKSGLPPPKSTPGGSFLQRAEWAGPWPTGFLVALFQRDAAEAEGGSLPTWRISAVRRRAARSSGMSPSMSRVPRRPPPGQDRGDAHASHSSERTK